MHVQCNRPIFQGQLFEKKITPLTLKVWVQGSFVKKVQKRVGKT